MGDEETPPARIDDGYDALLADLRAIISAGRGRVAAVVNAEIVTTFWKMGERIVREEQGGTARAAYGAQLLGRLGRALSPEFGRALSERNLQQIRQFYLTYPNANALRSELTWTHYRRLVQLPDAAERAFYERVAAQSRWSSRELDKQINSMLYERTALSRKPEQLLAALPQGDTSPGAHAEAFHDPVILDFLGLEDTYSEKDLEAALVRHIEKFLLELGSDFYFGGRQKRLTIGDDDYYVDLLLFHRGLRAPVYVDLKLGKLTHADISQMRLYLTWARRHDKREGENDPVGLILCGSKNEQVIELLLADDEGVMDEQIKVVQYLLLTPQDREALKERLAQLSALRDQLVDDADAAPDAGVTEGDEH